MNKENGAYLRPGACYRKYGIFDSDFKYFSQSCNRGKKVNRKKQPSRAVLKKRCSENMQQIYWRAPMPKCDFNKV